MYEMGARCCRWERRGIEMVLSHIQDLKMTREDPPMQAPSGNELCVGVGELAHLEAFGT